MKVRGSSPRVPTKRKPATKQFGGGLVLCLGCHGRIVHAILFKVYFSKIVGKNDLIFQSMIHVVTGCMFSGKTEELIRLIRRAQYAELNTLVFKPMVDTRSSKEVQTHSENTWPAFNVTHPEEILTIVDGVNGAARRCDVVGIDEAQFFEQGVVDVVQQLTATDVKVIVAGLDMDFLGRPFGPMPYLLAMADTVTKLTAVCMCCKTAGATHTQRLIDGIPADADSPLVLIGSEDSYEARCRACHTVG